MNDPGNNEGVIEITNRLELLTSVDNNLGCSQNDESYIYSDQLDCSGLSQYPNQTNYSGILPIINQSSRFSLEPTTLPSHNLIYTTSKNYQDISSDEEHEKAEPQKLRLEIEMGNLETELAPESSKLEVEPENMPLKETDLEKHESAKLIVKFCKIGDDIFRVENCSQNSGSTHDKSDRKKSGSKKKRRKKTSHVSSSDQELSPQKVDVSSLLEFSSKEKGLSQEENQDFLVYLQKIEAAADSLPIWNKEDIASESTEFKNSEDPTIELSSNLKNTEDTIDFTKNRENAEDTVGFSINKENTEDAIEFTKNKEDTEDTTIEFIKDKEISEDTASELTQNKVI